MPNLKQHKCITPMLFIVFNRPSCTARVFEAIRNARPHQLFIAADGPRQQISTDEINCLLVREIVSQVDWDCNVKFFRANETLDAAWQ